MTIEIAMIRVLVISVSLLFGQKMIDVVRKYLELDLYPSSWWKGNYHFFAFFWFLYTVFTIPFVNDRTFVVMFGGFLVSGIVLFIAFPFFTKNRPIFMPFSEFLRSRNITASDRENIRRLTENQAVRLYIELTGCHQITAQRQVANIRNR
jgi:hypothetical protein